MGYVNECGVLFIQNLKEFKFIVALYVIKLYRYWNTLNTRTAEEVTLFLIIIPYFQIPYVRLKYGAS